MTTWGILKPTKIKGGVISYSNWGRTQRRKGSPGTKYLPALRIELTILLIREVKAERRNYVLCGVWPIMGWMLKMLCGNPCTMHMLTL